MILAAFFVLAALLGLLGLVVVDIRTVPPVTGTCALILTLAAFYAAILR
ncbi:hypothetical protein OKJ48_39375 [Streptomyces kunmingensis]|uniref:Uncharacterized protein n=1 Tax=Streptomyces kunmingensis TaxID=68225 RepID=A0ABU6CQP4_9ACTN|nr:hypothetical protein [Streptomyces kunmingensis]MEB3966245.1 hypothetical protein [Streptomyces kunmingensis]